MAKLFNLKLIWITLIIAGIGLLVPTQVDAALPSSFAYDKPVYKSITNANRQKLITDLTTEVTKMLPNLELEPAYFTVGIASPTIFWHYPGEQIYILAQTIPYLPATTATELKTKLAAYVRKYPPHTYTSLYNRGSGCCSTQVYQSGQLRREYYPAEPNSGLMHNVWPPAEIPTEALYMLWAYADYTGDWDYISTEWNNIVNFYNNRSSQTVNRYGQIAGMIGMTRLANKMKTAPYNKSNAASIQTTAEAKVNQALPSASFMTFLNYAEQNIQNRTFDWGFPIFCSSHRNSLVNCFFTPEIARIIRDKDLVNAQTEVEKHTGNSTTYFNSPLPGWFINRSDYSYYEFRYGNRNGSYGHENSYRTPDHIWTWTMLKNYVLNQTGDTAYNFIDVPATRLGDLYYIQGVVSAIDAYGNECWQDIRTGAEVCEQSSTTSLASSSTAPATSATKCTSDITGDRIVDLSDYSLLVSKFFQQSTQADLTGEGFVDLSDYSILVSRFLKPCT